MSGPLRILAVMALFVAPALSANVIKGGAVWLSITLLVMMGLTTLATMTAYFLAFARDPDLLRSEAYQLANRAMERGYTGDSVIGLARSESALAAPKIKAVSVDSGVKE